MTSSTPTTTNGFNDDQLNSHHDQRLQRRPAASMKTNGFHDDQLDSHDDQRLPRRPAQLPSRPTASTTTTWTLTTANGFHDDHLDSHDDQRL
jgi:hypothetical protein